jgi:hypothetical protein
VTQTGSSILGPPAAADLDGDCGVEVVVTTMDGTIEVFAADGSPQLVLQSLSGEGFVPGPTLADLDGDGDLEIIAAAMDQRIYAFHHDGTPLAGAWPVLARDLSEPAPLEAAIASSPAVADIDGDGSPEVVVGSNETYAGFLTLQCGRLYAFHADGSLAPGWPVGGESFEDLCVLADSIVPLIGEGVPAGPTLYDLDGDGDREVLVGAPISPPVIYDGDGSIYATQPINGNGVGSNATQPDTFFGMASPVVADVDGDGLGDLIAPTVSLDMAAIVAGDLTAMESTVSAWDLTANEWLPGYPRLMEDWQFATAVSVADVGGDSRPEIVTGSGGYLLHGFDADGSEPPGWPKFAGGWLLAAPALGDLEGDGDLEVVAWTREGNLFVWETTAPAPAADPLQEGLEPSLRFQHDARNTGDVHADAHPPAPVLDLSASRSGGMIDLTWTASGDDGWRGRATTTEVRFAFAPFDCADWNAAIEVTGVPSPAPAGSAESFSFPDPDPAQPLWVALRPVDESGNWPPVFAVQARLPTGLLRSWAGELRPVTPTLAELLPLQSPRDLYLPDFAGGPDPDDQVLGDPNRPLVLYGLEQAESLYLAKSADRRRILIAF